jgi:hypothetical protein
MVHYVRHISFSRVQEAKMDYLGALDYLAKKEREDT